MMKEKQNLCRKGRMAGLFFLIVLYAFSGCGTRDAAIQIPVKEETLNREIIRDEESQEREIAEAEQIFVHVCGCVVSPGVVELPQGSRVSDALQAAGGFTEDAETSYVNLAAKVEDGEKLYFPSVEESEELQAQTLDGQTGTGLVNINTAGADALCTLSGIGEARAGDIIAYREENGPFQSKEDIMKVPGIKENAYKKICDNITVK
ncbi:MAG: helix-hairpin-helix domain-containing protein [Clostridium sp.]|nr:helix-hairpin-helix domain-containing protein [Clostridium sp.]